jgi:hypothetical protein
MMLRKFATLLNFFGIFYNGDVADAPLQGKPSRHTF